MAEQNKTPTTGHEWDGVTELNTPLPKWWAYVFWATILWAIGYWVVYPAWPSLSGYTKGVIGYSSHADYEDKAAAAAQARRVWTDRIDALTVDAVVADSELLQYAAAGGRSVFAENCAPCHGAGGQGAAGYPILADDDWLWGGTAADIYQTVQYGVRSEHDGARLSEMPKFGADGLLDEAAIADAAEYVLSLSNRSEDAAATGRGQTIFAENCAVCHGDAGQGIKEFGAPRLTDDIWLHGGERNDIVAQITNPRQGVMPAWSGRLGDTGIKMVSIYVHSLGGGQ